MKAIKNVLLVLAITFASVVSANNEPTKGEPSTLSKEISVLLEDPNFIVKDVMRATLTIMVNKKNEIVVLSVDSGNEKLENFVKSRLNYKKMNILLENKNYTVPVRFVPID